MSYKLLRSGGVRDLLRGVDIKPDPSSAEWQAYRAWLRDGGNLEPADPEPVPVPTPAEVAAQAEIDDDLAAHDAAKVNPVIAYLATHTPAQITAKVQADVVSLATARDMLTHLAVAVGVMARRQLR